MDDLPPVKKTCAQTPERQSLSSLVPPFHTVAYAAANSIHRWHESDMIRRFAQAGLQRLGFGRARVRCADAGNRLSFLAEAGHSLSCRQD